jgi:hypothetical protein
VALDIAQRSQLAGIAFACQDGRDDAPAGQTRNVGQHLGQLDVHLLEGLLHVLDVAGGASRGAQSLSPEPAAERGFRRRGISNNSAVRRYTEVVSRAFSKQGGCSRVLNNGCAKGGNKIPIPRHEVPRFAAADLCSGHAGKDEIVIDLIDAGVTRSAAQRLVEEMTCIRKEFCATSNQVSEDEVLRAWTDRGTPLEFAPVEALQQTGIPRQREADVAAAVHPARSIALKRPTTYRVIGGLALSYGVLLAFLWISCLGPAVGQEVLIHGGIRVELIRGGDLVTNLTILLHGSAPILLIVTGVALCCLHAGTSRRARANVAMITAMFTALVLAAKAVVGVHWVMAGRLEDAKGSPQIGGVGELLWILVVIPSGVSALVLGLTAISLWLELVKQSGQDGDSLTRKADGSQIGGEKSVSDHITLLGEKSGEKSVSDHITLLDQQDVCK